MTDDVYPRKAGCLLMLGILFLPFIFVWFVLRDGYSTPTRVIAVIWLMIYMSGGTHETVRIVHHYDSPTYSTPY